MLRHYPFHVVSAADDECTEGTRACRTHVRLHAYTEMGVAHVRGDLARTRPRLRTGSTGIETPSKPSQPPRLDLSRESRERVHERTHTQPGTRAESRSQSPAVGGCFDVAAAAATFATLNTFISRSVGSPSFLPTLSYRVASFLLLCGRTTLSTSFCNSSRCPRGLNFTPCRDSRVRPCSNLPRDTINSPVSVFFRFGLRKAEDS